MLGWLLRILEVWAAATCICKRHSAASYFSSSNSPKKWSTPSGAMWSLVEIDTQRDVGVEGPKMHVDGAADGGLHHSGVILRNAGAPLICNKELRSERGAGWSWRPRMAERLVPKVVAGKEVGGWLRLEEQVSLVLFSPITVEIRDRFQGLRCTPPHTLKAIYCCIYNYLYNICILLGIISNPERI